MFEKTVAAAGIGTASLLLLAAPATALGAGPSPAAAEVTHQAAADEPAGAPQEPWLKDTCVLPFRFEGPLADVLKLERTVVSAACIGRSKS